MELSIQQLRSKQKKRFTAKIFISLFILALIAVPVYLYFNNGKSNDSTDSESEKEKPIHRICLTTDISAEVQDEIKSIDYKKYIDKDLYEFQFVTSAPAEIEKKACDTVISRKIADDSDYERIWSKHFVLVTTLDNPIENLDSADLNTLIRTQTFENQFAIWDNDITDSFIKVQFGTTAGQAYPDSQAVLKKLDELYNPIAETEAQTSTTAAVTPTTAPTSPTTEAKKQLVAIIPFEDVIPGLKIIDINGKSPIDKTFSQANYPLVDNYWIKSTSSTVSSKFRVAIRQTFGDENYDSSKLYDIVMTGNSAVGARIYPEVTKTQNDENYPVRGIADIMREATLTQISNKSPFSEGCVQASYSKLLCGSPTAISQLLFAGVDVVSLVGENVMDTGRPDFESTLDLLNTNEIMYYAGGMNFNEAHKPLIVELGQLKVAFIGYNFLPPYSYGAGKTFSGNSQYTTAIMQNDIMTAKNDLKADFIFVDMNWGTETQKQATADQIGFANEVQSVGANVITGYNPLYINPFELNADKPTFYSLGNTLYSPDPETRVNQQYGLIVRHLFYNDRYIGFELIPTYIDANYQTRLLEMPTKATMIEEIIEKSSIKLNLPADSNDSQSIED